ncbi:hypothetical protein M413DRAFT_351501 [Hebeloma cylindrosporum]|uniref:Uncharacterized protein n=1 Tax=Hebeloma cylindrosporum TaxID=76867 RepID=A0A0C2XBB6_HEBCY|nr:hypothetical protein M413DRAFT_351501 [Hebeloma cylindrosporum h7]
MMFQVTSPKFSSDKCNHKVTSIGILFVLPCPFLTFVNLAGYSKFFLVIVEG